MVDIQLTQEYVDLWRTILEKVSCIQEHTAPSELVLWKGTNGYPGNTWRFPLPGMTGPVLVLGLTETALIIRVTYPDGSVITEFTQPVRWCGCVGDIPTKARCE